MTYLPVKFLLLLPLLVGTLSFRPPQTEGQRILPLEAKLKGCTTKIDSANCYRQLGDEYCRLGKTEDALECYQNSERLSRQGRHFLNLFLIRLQIGRILQEKEDYNTAMSYYRGSLRAYAHLNEEQKRVPFIQKNLAAIYNNQGAIYCFWGEIGRASDKYQKALEILGKEEYSDKNLEATLRLNLGLLYSECGRYQEALDQAKRCQELTSDQRTLAKSYTLLASIYAALSDWEKCFHYNQRALEEEKSTYNYINLSMDYLHQGKLNQALSLAQEGLNRASSNVERALAYIQMGDIYSCQRKWQKALDFYNKALPLQKHLDYTRGLIGLYNKLGKLYYNLLEFKLSLSCFKKASLLINPTEMPDIAWYTFYGMGKAYEAEKELKKALSFYKRAINLIERVRKGLKVPEYRAGFIEDKLAAYEAIIKLLVTMGDYIEAFNYVERSKARSFLDLLGSPKIHIKAGGELYEKERDLSQQIFSLEKKIYGEKRGYGYRDLSKITEKLKKLRQQYEELLIEIKASNPELASLVCVEPIDLNTTQKIIEPDIAIIEYFITEYQLYAWIITTKEVNFMKMEKKASELDSQVRAFRNAICKQEVSKIQRYSRILYNTLISPLRSFLSYSTICFVPYGFLHYLPFHALFNGENYLIDNFTVFYVPSCSILNFCIAKRKENKGKILALGDPESDLPFVEEEVECLREIYPSTKVLLKKQATETAVKRMCKGYDVLHLACHGELQADQPLFSYLRLAEDPDNDGLLKVYEVFEMEMNAYLTVLSACETALGKWRKGDELISLCKAFICAGTPSVLASLWKVTDISTAILMNQFYTNVRKGQNKAQALRDAQIRLRSQYNNPFFWASFILMGDWK